MKKMTCFVTALIAACCLVGCVSVEKVQGKNLSGQNISAQGTPVAHLNVQNSGIYLFTLPLLTGSTSDVGSISVFKDTVNTRCVSKVLADEAKKLGGAKALDVASQYSEFGFIFYSRELNMSANVVK